MANREGESQTQSESLSIDTTPMSPRPSMELQSESLSIDTTPIPPRPSMELLSESSSIDTTPMSPRPSMELQSESSSIDTTPIPPRSSMELEENEVESNQEVPRYVNRQQVNTPATDSLKHLPNPHIDWKLNVFLKEISEDLSKEELNVMKFLLHGQGGIGRKVQEKMQSPLDFFRTLQDRILISSDNLLFLQTILFHVGRKDLVEKAVKYSNSHDNILHFATPSEFPENGYKYVRFHIEGKDFSTYTKDDLEKLRTKVGNWLCVPPQFIFVHGIQPSESLIITLMIPEMYVDILIDLLKENIVPSDLHNLGIDIIAVDGEKPFGIEDSSTVVEISTEQQNKLVVIYEQLEQTRSQLDRTEEANLDLRRLVSDLQEKVSTLKSNLEKADLRLQVLDKIVSSASTGPQSHPATLRELSSLAEFKESINKICLEPVDKNVVTNMLNATVNIVSAKVNESHRILHQRMLLDLQEMRSNIEPLKFELEQYRLLTNVSNIDKGALETLLHLIAMLSIGPTFGSVKIPISHQEFVTLGNVANELRPKEKEKIKRKHNWNSQDELNIPVGENAFLSVIYMKEFMNGKTDLSAYDFTRQCLSEVGRNDLKKFLEDKQSWSNSQQRTNGSAARGQQYQQQPEQVILIEKMATQIEEMYSMLKKKETDYSKQYEAWKSPSVSFPFQHFASNQA